MGTEFKNELGFVDLPKQLAKEKADAAKDWATLQSQQMIQPDPGFWQSLANGVKNFAAEKKLDYAEMRAGGNANPFAEDPEENRRYDIVERMRKARQAEQPVDQELNSEWLRLLQRGEY